MVKIYQPDYQRTIFDSAISLKTVLIVDDEPGNYLENLKTKLIYQGHTVYGIYKDRNSAIAYLPDLTYQDCVAILDCHFPGNVGGRPDALGARLAYEIHRNNSAAGIFSYSESWEGDWPNPRYDSLSHHSQIDGIDNTGQPELLKPYLNLLGTDTEIAAELVSRWNDTAHQDYLLQALVYFNNSGLQLQLFSIYPSNPLFTASQFQTGERWVYIKNIN